MAAYEVLLLNTAVPQIQAAQSGDTYVVPRDIAFSAALTLSAGTANGVPYLNGSKVVTTGSALTFDGTEFYILGSQRLRAAGTGSTANGYRLDAGAQTHFWYLSDNFTSAFNIGSSAGQWTWSNSNGEISRITSTGLKSSIAGTNSDPVFSYTSDTNTGIFFPAADKLGFVAGGGADQMVLTTTGLGIGTSSPNYPLHINGTPQIQLTNSTTGTTTGDGSHIYLSSSNLWVVNKEAASINFATSNTLQATLDSSGNLGLGVTPSAWGSSNRALQVATTGAIWSPGGVDTRLSNNQYRDSASSRVYITNGPAQEYAQDSSGKHIWFTAASGNAGDPITFTQAMTLDASGNLAFRQASSTTTTVGFQNSSGTQIQRILYNDSDGSLGIGGGTATAYPLKFFSGNTQAMTLDASGNLLVGTTSVTGLYNGTSGDDGLGVSSNGCAQIQTGNDSNIYCSKPSGYTNSNFLYFNVNSAGVGSIATSGTATSYNTSSDYRLKDNLQPLTGSGAFIDALQPKTWDWKADGSKGVGFIAHEVQEVSPSTVHGEKDAVDADGKPIMQAMEYGSAEFIANIIAELQSLRARVAQLEQGA